MKTLYVGGSFDDKGGKESKIACQIFQPIANHGIDFINGGNFSVLERIVGGEIRNYGIIHWFADVPNDKPKLVRKIKEANNKCILVTSKRNTECKYAFSDLVAHALNVKSNLLLEFVKENNLYKGRVIDPLGNVFIDFTPDFNLIGKVLKKRVGELAGYTRISSMPAGKKADIPEAAEFFELTKDYGELFHDIVHSSIGHARFMGNVSFRCERGFPSFRDNGIIYVSRRNVDKRHIKKESFVAVENSLPVKFYGENKPSVDTPSQISLYNFYPNIRYMLHSHTYINNAPFTERIVPCGAIEEADDIMKIYTDNKMANFAVNLKGHGSLALARDINYLKAVEYKIRKMPEIHHGYL